MIPTKEIIEEGAKGAYEAHRESGDPPWDELLEPTRNGYRTLAKGVLTAALSSQWKGMESAHEVASLLHRLSSRKTWSSHKSTCLCQACVSIRDGHQAATIILSKWGLIGAIMALEKDLPGWWWSIGNCSVSADASCGPDRSGPDAALLEIKLFDDGFHADLRHPSDVATALLDVIEQAKEAKAAVPPPPAQE